MAKTRTFPNDISKQLLGVDYRLLDELSFLAKQQRKKTGASYAMPGRQYLAQKIGCSVRTISRSIQRLKRLGILDSTQRRPVRGIWKTNLYKIRSWVGWRLGQLSGALRKLSHRGPRLAHIASLREKIQTSEPLPPPHNALGEEILARWKARGLVQSPIVS